MSGVRNASRLLADAFRVQPRPFLKQHAMFKSVLSVSRCSRSLLSSQRSVPPLVSRVSFSVTGSRQYSASSPKLNENATTTPRPAPASGALNPTPWVNTSTTEPSASASTSKAEPADSKFPLPPAPEASNNILTDAEMKEYLVPLYNRGWFVGFEEKFVLKKSLKFRKDRDALDVLREFGGWCAEADVRLRNHLLLYYIPACYQLDRCPPYCTYLLLLMVMLLFKKNK